MLVMENGYYRRGLSSTTTSPSILDSPTLARVERARLRHEIEEQNGNGNNSPLQYTLSSYCPSLVSVDPGREMHALKKGLLWQQRERLFSRWKERYFILTRDYLHCFKRSSGNEKISNMGQFIFKVKLVDVEKVQWVNKKSYSTVALVLQDRDYRILLRTNDGLEDWFELLEECTMTSKERRKALHKYGDSKALWSNMTDSCSKFNYNRCSNIDNWLLSRANPAIGLDQTSLSDSVPDLQQSDQLRYGDEHIWRQKGSVPYHHRLSLLTDIDINNCDNSADMPSTKSTLRSAPYQYNGDVFFLAANNEKRYSNSVCTNNNGRPGAGSFRNNNLPSPTRIAQERYNSAYSPMSIKYRDRSHSDAFNCKSRNLSGVVNRCSFISQQTTNV